MFYWFFLIISKYLSICNDRKSKRIKIEWFALNKELINTELGKVVTKMAISFMAWVAFTWGAKDFIHEWNLKQVYATIHLNLSYVLNFPFLQNWKFHTILKKIIQNSWEFLVWCCWWTFLVWSSYLKTNLMVSFSCFDYLKKSKPDFSITIYRILLK